jgi:hypothetical protein
MGGERQEGAMARKPKGVRANANERMIEIKLRFWTNNIASKKGYVIPKHAWTSGMVRMEKNKTHGIMAMKPKPFNSLMDIGSVIEKILLAHGVVLRTGKKMKRYIEKGQ